MRLGEDLLRVRFIRRHNRFLVEVESGGSRLFAHLPNSGRLQELLIPGSPAAIKPRPEKHRKTRYDLEMIEIGGVWISCDARLPTSLLIEALEQKRIQHFTGYTGWKREVTFGASRLDLLLTGQGKDCLVECKSVTLVEDGTALFPDAPTVRGARHMRELIAAVKEGYNAAAVFVIQRPDAENFMPNFNADPDFVAACHEASSAGVQLIAFRCATNFGMIDLDSEIPVIIGSNSN
jgi:sugar fermentation stimulation protein A